MSNNKNTNTPSTPPPTPPTPPPPPPPPDQWAHELAMNAGLYVVPNDCCGGHDGMRVIDDTHTVTWSSGECGGTKPTPQGSRWMPVDASDADAAEVVDDEASMHNFYWRLVESQWIEDAP